MDEQRRPAAVVTGATGRLGRLSCHALARRGADLVLVARRPDRLAEVAQELRTAVPEATVDVHVGDLRLLAETERVGDGVAATHSRLDAVVHHADRHGTPERTSEGIPDLVAVNYLAPWLLTDRLLGRLAASGDARVITFGPPPTTAAAPIVLPEDLLDTQFHPGARRRTRYADSHLFTAMFSQELTRRRTEAGLRSICVATEAPGWLHGLASLADPAGWVLPASEPRRLRLVAELVAGLALEPAATPGRPAAGEYVTSPGGDAGDPPAPAGDPALRQQLWNITEALITSGTAAGRTGTPA